MQFYLDIVAMMNCSLPLWFIFNVSKLRTESNLYKERVDAQAKELIQWKQRVEELEEKERVANENVGPRFCLTCDTNLRIQAFLSSLTFHDGLRKKL